MFEKISRTISGRKVDFLTADRPRKKPTASQQEEIVRRHIAFTALAQCIEKTDRANVTDVREYKYAHGSTRYEADVDYWNADGKLIRYTMNVAVIPSDLARIELRK